jgi:hypothetical protein
VLRILEWALCAESDAQSGPVHPAEGAWYVDVIRSVQKCQHTLVLLLSERLFAYFKDITSRSRGDGFGDYAAGCYRANARPGCLGGLGFRGIGEAMSSFYSYWLCAIECKV